MVKLMDKDVWEHRKQWDRYKRFHVVRGYGLVQFDTGETILTEAKFSPDMRERSYNGLVFLMGADQHNVLNCLFDPENDRPVRKTWLQPGNYFMADLATRQFVSLYRWGTNTKVHPSIPAYLAEFNPVAYHGGEGRRWVTANKLSYVRTVRPTKEQHEHVREITMLCKTQERLGGFPDDARFKSAIDWSGWNPAPWSDVVTMAFDKLDIGSRAIIARFGVGKPRELVTVSELAFREV